MLKPAENIVNNPIAANIDPFRHFFGNSGTISMLMGTTGSFPIRANDPHGIFKEMVVQFKLIKGRLIIGTQNKYYVYKMKWVVIPELYMVKEFKISEEYRETIIKTFLNNQLHSFKGRPASLYKRYLIKHNGDVLKDYTKEYFRNGQRHNDGVKPALYEYKCHRSEIGKFYYKFGISVTKQFCETPIEDLDIKKELQNSNVQYRAMIFQLIGYSRVIQKLGGEVIDKQGDIYELIKCKEQIDVEPLVVLKMKCPSTGVYYCERVPPGMLKVVDALKWREGDEGEYEPPKDRT